MGCSHSTNSAQGRSKSDSESNLHQSSQPPLSNSLSSSFGNASVQQSQSASILSPSSSNVIAGGSQHQLDSNGNHNEEINDSDSGSNGPDSSVSASNQSRHPRRLKVTTSAMKRDQEHRRLASEEEKLLMDRDMLAAELDQRRQARLSAVVTEGGTLGEMVNKLALTVPSKEMFDMKRRLLKHHFGTLRDDQSGPWWVIVRRASVLGDSVRSFGSVDPADLHRVVKVKFQGEPGIDEGGVVREWFTIVSREIVNPDYALFQISDVDSYCYQINPHSDINPNHLQYFFFLGQLMAKALFDSHSIDCHFTPYFYKTLLGRPLSLRDVETVDADFYNSLKWINENSVDESDMGLFFCTEESAFGATKVVDLIENGRNVAVTDLNKREYVRCMATHRLTKGVEQQMDIIKAGFHSLVPEPIANASMDEMDLELMICGLPSIDLKDWKDNTEYRSGYHSSHPSIVMFWKMIEDWSQEELARLLQFCTGTSKVPTEGFAGLKGTGIGPCRFRIVKVVDVTRLPQANTCVNQLILPDYHSGQISLEEMKKKFIISLYETEGIHLK